MNFIIIKTLTMKMSERKQYRTRKMKSYTPSLKFDYLDFTQKHNLNVVQLNVN